MAAALVSIVLEQLSILIRLEIEEEVRLVFGVENGVQRLTHTFKSIQCVLADAEARQLKEDDVKVWLDELRDISYEMDDVLDDWSTAINKAKLDQYQQVGEDDQGHARTSKNKVNCFTGPCTCFPLTKFGRRHNIAHRIKGLYGRLEVIAKENERRLNFTVSDRRNNEQVIDRAMTSSFVDKTEVKGRDKEKNTIVEMLVSENSHTPKLRIVSIVGMGGLGKTTLAQLVYNDEKIKECFDRRIWVCVSDPFEEIKVANGILQSLSGQASTFGALQPVMEQVENYLHGKRFLLVLDDVWNEDSEKWRKLKDGLVNWGSRGSRILVTTRKENVASIMGCTRSDIFQPGVLSEEECWLVFSEIAFSDRTTAERQQLEGMGRKIADKCDGLPLAAKALGGLLRFRKSRAEWKSVLESEVWELKYDQIEANLFAPLWLSYIDLRPELKQCFAFCAVFPKDYKMEKDELIKLWMSQGYLKGTTMEMIGEQYFQNLAHRSFFQEFDETDRGGLSCKMHDIVHDFAQFITRKECVSLEVNDDDPIKESTELKNHLRHLYVKAVCISLPRSFYGFKKLRSLNVDGLPGYGYDYGAALPSIFKELTCLRCLGLRRCNVKEIPSAIGSWKHLRFLDLSSNFFKELPESTCELYNLQVLVLRECSNLVGLPTEIGKLLNLRHLYVSSSNICFLPKGIGRLSSLTKLDFFNVGHGCHAFCLADLRRLNHLSGSLRITNLGGDEADVAEAKEALLNNKRNLSRLTLVFCEEHKTERVTGDQELIEALEAPPNLEELSILNYQGSIFYVGCTRWMQISEKLRVIELRNFRNCGSLPPLGKLQFLEHLVISRMDGVKKVGNEFFGLEQQNAENDDDTSSSSSSSSENMVIFPNLVRLEFVYMSCWEEWDFGSTEQTEATKFMVIMPSITYLSIRVCPVLEALPDQLIRRTTPLKRLQIVRCDLLTERYNEGTGEDWPKISHIPDVEVR